MDAAVERIDSWVVSQQIRPGSYAATDFDFTRPRVNLLSQLQGPLGNAADAYPLFDYPGKFLTAAAGNQSVKVRLQETQVFHRVADASGNHARGSASATCFSMVDFPRDDQNAEYLVVSASYELHAAILGSGGRQGQRKRIFRHVQGHREPAAIPPGARTRTSRASRGRRRRSSSGRQGEEITTDKYGRVKVQFHWDREGTNDQDSSCWVRVAQVWAGSGWGAMHIPRIGQEVIVEFLEGDPDRPIITGRVYNADNMPPYDAARQQDPERDQVAQHQGRRPGQLQRDPVRRQKGREELHVQAERDQSTHVKRNQSISVDGDRSVSVGGNESISVTGHAQQHHHQERDADVQGRPRR